MATTATKVAPDISFGNLKAQVWTVTIGGGDTTATWDTGIDNVVYVGAASNSDQAFGGVYRNYSDAGSTVAAGNIHIAGLANSSELNVLVIGH